MKKYLSVFEMIARSTLYKVLLVLIIIVPLQLLLFWRELQDSEKALEIIVDDSHMLWLLAAGFLLITGLLGLCGCNIGSNQGYTLRRLQIPELHVLGLQAVYNCLVYLILWASQVAVFLIAGNWYMENAAETTNQTLVLAFYRNPYMHSILPMEDALGWIVLIGLLLFCGIASAVSTYRQRRGTLGFGVIAAIATVFIIFPRGLGSDISFLIYFPIALLIGYSTYTGIMNVVKGESKDE